MIIAIILMKSSSVFDEIVLFFKRNNMLVTITVKPGQAYPQDSINEFIIWKLNPLVVVDFRFISAFLHAQWAMKSHAMQDFTKFLPALFPWIWCKCLVRNLIHSKTFNMTKCRNVLVKFSLLVTHGGMLIWIWHQLQEQLTDSFN